MVTGRREIGCLCDKIEKSLFSEHVQVGIHPRHYYLARRVVSLKSGKPKLRFE